MATKKQRNPDHVRPRHKPGPSNEVIEAQLTELLTPAVYSQLAYYRQLGLRSRILGLPLMVAAVLTLLWRQVPSARELTKLLAREDVLWCKAVKVSQQALSKRLLAFPAELFERVFKDLLPTLAKRWQQRRRRALPPAIIIARQTFDRIWIVDGSTLEALFRKLESLQEAPIGQLAGKICAVIELTTRLPVEIWYREGARDQDTNFVPELLALIPGPKTLLIFDRGLYDFTFFADLLAKGAQFISRLKSNASYTMERVLTQTDTVRDGWVVLGGGPNGQPILRLRLVQIKFGQVWYSYLTSVLDPTVLPPYVVADLYRRRWRIEEAFNTVKRLLGLAYLWTGSINGVLLQIWATWLFYAILVDLGDAVADEIGVPFDRISLEMLFRGLYHFTQAYAKGKATDPIAYFAAPENQDLDVVKPLRKPHKMLNLSPYPI
jgi:hypothetical protein